MREKKGFKPSYIPQAVLGRQYLFLSLLLSLLQELFGHEMKVIIPSYVVVRRLSLLKWHRCLCVLYTHTHTPRMTGV